MMKSLALSTLTDLFAHPADSIIDVRSPAEFAEDHLPGAINLPVLSDEERARIGTIYARQSPFQARKIGGALVAQNTATHLQGPLAAKQGDWQPLVYCWRGGQRSGAFATILDQVGWRVTLLKGGYQSYRRRVVDLLYHQALDHRLVLIEGGTGTAKTHLLSHLAGRGAQILDLEGLANHRGSLFGAMKGGQPSQKQFESRIAAELMAQDPAQITFVEAESSKVGECLVPPSLWAAMQEAPRLAIEAPLSARAEFLCRAYADLTEEAEALASRIDALRPYHAREKIEQWHVWAAQGDFERLAEALVRDHYDPRYAKSASEAPSPLARIPLQGLQEADLEGAAVRLISEAENRFLLAPAQ